MHTAKTNASNYSPPNVNYWGDRCCKAEAENARLLAIEAAALRFLKEADERPRYLTVKTWATREADPYLKLRAALGRN